MTNWVLCFVRAFSTPLIVLFFHSFFPCGPICSVTMRPNACANFAGCPIFDTWSYSSSSVAFHASHFLSFGTIDAQKIHHSLAYSRLLFFVFLLLWVSLYIPRTRAFKISRASFKSVIARCLAAWAAVSTITVTDSSFANPSCMSRINFSPYSRNLAGLEISMVSPSSSACSRLHPLTSAGMGVLLPSSRRSMYIVVIRFPASSNTNPSWIQTISLSIFVASPIVFDGGTIRQLPSLYKQKSPNGCHQTPLKKFVRRGF